MYSLREVEYFMVMSKASFHGRYEIWGYDDMAKS
jgi:hypothetical protein